MGRLKNLERLQQCNKIFYKLTIIFIGMLIGTTSEGYAWYDDGQECPSEPSNFLNSFVNYNNQGGKCNPKVFESRKDLHEDEIKELERMKENFNTSSFRNETKRDDKLWGNGRLRGP